MPPQKLKVSVVMPLYNKGAEVQRAISSVLAQTVSDLELIVVNDGSTDNGPELVRSIKDSRIRVIDQENEGVSSARNRGIVEAKTDLITFLDADDEWKPSFLETILSLRVRFPTCKVFATNYVYREINGTCRLPIIRGLPAGPWEGILKDYFGVAAKSDPPICASAVAVTKDAINSVGRFPVGVTSGEDLLTWARLAVKYKLAYTTQPHAIFYVPSNVYARPGRFSATRDLVGPELTGLLRNAGYSERRSLKKYVALWHKNRSVSFLELGNHWAALQELQLMSRFSEKSIQWYIYALLASLPKPLTPWLMKRLKTMRSLRRTAIPAKQMIKISRMESR